MPRSEDALYRPVPFGSTSLSDADLEALLRLVYVGGGFTDASIADSLFRGVSVRARGQVIVALDAVGTLLGTVVVVPFGSSACRFATLGTAELHLLCGRPETRGRGVGSALVDAAVAAGGGWGIANDSLDAILDDSGEATVRKTRLRTSTSTRLRTR